MKTRYVYVVMHEGRDYFFIGTSYADIEQQCLTFFKCTNVNDSLMPYSISRKGKLEEVQHCQELKLPE